jgi:hypothetical protein
MPTFGPLVVLRRARAPGLLLISLQALGNQQHAQNVRASVLHASIAMQPAEQRFCAARVQSPQALPIYAG